MKFKLESPNCAIQPSVDYSSKIILLGSCFSDEMASQLKLAGLSYIANPFGTIFHPIPLAKIILESLAEKPNFDLLNHRKIYYSWDASHLIYASSKDEMINLMEERFRALKLALNNATHLFITLGSAWSYQELNLNKIVANCHKKPADQFKKSLSTISEMLPIWEQTISALKKANPNLKICFTISPVRHVKDGLVENNRSKARLFELISQLENQFELSYFPAYEILIDELRDYRFYQSDLVHPSDAAIQYIWEGWLSHFCLSEVKSFMKEVLALRALEAHIVLHPNSDEGKAFVLDRKIKIQSFLDKNPLVVW